METARAVPTPRTVVRLATGWVASSRSDPLQPDKISWPMPRAERPSDPLPSKIASSSLELRAWAPWVLSRSRGRSAAGSSRIVSVNLFSLGWSRDDRFGRPPFRHLASAHVIAALPARTRIPAAPSAVTPRTETKRQSRPCSRPRPRARPARSQLRERPRKNDRPGARIDPPAET
jgi:hypothetical protein